MSPPKKPPKKRRKPHPVDSAILVFDKHGQIWVCDGPNPKRVVGKLEAPYAPAAAAGPMMYRILTELQPLVEHLLVKADLDPDGATDAVNLQKIGAAIDYAVKYSRGEA